MIDCILDRNYDPDDHGKGPEEEPNRWRHAFACRDGVLMDEVRSFEEKHEIKILDSDATEPKGSGLRSLGRGSQLADDDKKVGDSKVKGKRKRDQY